MINKIFPSWLVSKKEVKCIPIQIEESQVNAVVKQSPKLSLTDSLAKQAAEIKSADVKQAIAIMKQVVDLEPNNLSYQFKLANYLQLSGEIREAYIIYDELFLALDPNQISKYNSDKAEVFEKYCSLHYKTGKYKEYLECYFYWLFNNILGLTFKGQVKELNKTLKVKNKLSLMAPAKVIGCFKRLGKEELFETFNEKLAGFFNEFSEEMISISKRIEKIVSKSKSKKDGYVIVQTDPDLIELFKKFNNQFEVDFYRMIFEQDIN